VIISRAKDPNSTEQRNTQMAKSRFIKSIVKTAETDTSDMPWTRGECRAVFISRRRNLAEARKCA
jgi:hypothetical protein